MDRFVKLSEALAIEGEFVNHQEMADLISKHKETKMQKQKFKLSRRLQEMAVPSQAKPPAVKDYEPRRTVRARFKQNK